MAPIRSRIFIHLTFPLDSPKLNQVDQAELTVRCKSSDSYFSRLYSDYLSSNTFIFESLYTQVSVLLLEYRVCVLLPPLSKGRDTVTTDWTKLSRILSSLGLFTQLGS